MVPGEDRVAYRLDVALQDRLVQLGIPTETEWIKGGMGSKLRGQLEASSAGIATTGSRSTKAAQPVEHDRGSNHRQETVRKLAHQAG